MTTLPEDTFRAAMQAHGLVLRDALLDDETADEELWRLQHLSAMARLALQADPDLVITADFSPEDLYAALSAAAPLEGSAVDSIRELLRFLAIIEHRGVHRPRRASGAPAEVPWGAGDPSELSEAGLGAYAAMLDAALAAAAAARPWRAELPAEDSRRKYLPSTPKDYFRGASPGVIPDLDKMDFSDILDEE